MHRYHVKNEYTQHPLEPSEAGSQEQPELLALAAAMDRIKMLEAEVANKEPASSPSPLQRAAPLTPASFAAAESDSVSRLKIYTRVQFSRNVF